MASRSEGRLSTEEKVDMVVAYVTMGKNKRLAAQFYASKHPRRHLPAQSSFVRIFNKFSSTGSVGSGRRSKAYVLDEKFEIGVLAFVRAKPEASIRQIAHCAGASTTSVWRVLLKHRMYPFHVNLHQELSTTDFQRRQDFCNWALIQIDRDPGFLQKVIWTDEAQFCRNSSVNLHNAHYWADVNPHWLRAHKHQVKWSVNVWCGIFNDRIVGPYFYEGSLSGSKYCEGILDGEVEGFIENLPLQVLREAWYQHDGAPAHSSRRAVKNLDGKFPQQWIGCNGPVPWPPRSPDLTPLDFFWWGYIKNEVFVDEPASVGELKTRIITACAAVEPAMLRRVLDSVRERYMMCVAADGQHFEHYL